MGLVDRVKNILLTPKTEWPVIAGETSSTADLLGGYVAPLAGVSALCGFVGQSLVGMSLPFVGTVRTPIVAGIGIAVLTFVFAIVGVFILSLIINALAPSFGGQKNPAQAMKVAVYSYTPAWIAGVLGIIPMLGILGILISLYGLYLLYLGLPRLMGNPEEKSIGYTIVVVICAIVVGFVFSLVTGAVTALTGGGLMGAMSRSEPQVTFEKGSPMGNLEDFGKKMEAASKKMEAAQKSGDPGKQVAAAMEGLGTVLGGGKRYEPVAVDTLKPLLPETVAGLRKTGSSAERGGMPGLEMARAETEYGDEGGGKRLKLEVVDTGGAGGLMGIAGWAMVQGDKEDANGIERTRKEGSRLVHERISKTGGENEFTVVVGNRFVVSAEGRGVTIDDLRKAANAVDLGRLESMKEQGAK